MLTESLENVSSPQAVGKTAHGKRPATDIRSESKKKSSSSKEKGAVKAQAGDISKGKAENGQKYPYPTEYGDHFETSSAALAHIEPLLYRY